MRAHVSDGANAPIHPAAPVERVVDGVILDVWRRCAQKEIPRERVGNRIIAGHGRSQPLRHASAVPAELVGRFL